MKVDAKIVTRLDALLVLGSEVLATRKAPPPRLHTDAFIDTQLALRWFTSCQSFLSRVFGPESEYYKNFTVHAARKPSYSPVNRAYGVLCAAKDDYVHEALFDLRVLVEAELFDDFLGQADHLLKAGFFQPAAVLAGAVLEDGLRKLCIRKGLVFDDTPKLDRMNSELAKNGVYNKLTQKRITALADLRNSAAHGHWDSFTTADVEEMIGSIRRFLEQHFD